MSKLVVPNVFGVLILKTIALRYGADHAVKNPIMAQDYLGQILERGVKAELLACGYCEKAIEQFFESVNRSNGENPDWALLTPQRPFGEVYP